MNRKQSKYYGHATGFTYYSVMYQNSGADTTFAVDRTFDTQREAIAFRDKMWDARFGDPQFRNVVAMWVDKVSMLTVGGVRL